MQKEYIKSWYHLGDMLVKGEILILEAYGYQYFMTYTFKKNGKHYNVSYLKTNETKCFAPSELMDKNEKLNNYIESGVLKIIARGKDCYPIVANSIARYWISKDTTPQYGQAIVNDKDLQRLREILIMSGVIEEPLYFLNQYSDSSFENKTCVVWTLKGKIIEYREIPLSYSSLM